MAGLRQAVARWTRCSNSAADDNNGGRGAAKRSQPNLLIVRVSTPYRSCLDSRLSAAGRAWPACAAALRRAAARWTCSTAPPTTTTVVAAPQGASSRGAGPCSRSGCSSAAPGAPRALTLTLALTVRAVPASSHMLYTTVVRTNFCVRYEIWRAQAPDQLQACHPFPLCLN